ncbi:MAG: hypothetical protein AAFX85_04535 [Pseudomonadota bacterium]
MEQSMTDTLLRSSALAALAFALVANHAIAKDCLSTDPDVSLATGYCDVPTTGQRIDGAAQPTGDPFYAIDCEDISGGNPGVPVEGFARFFLVADDLDCNGPVIGTEASRDLFGPPERLELITEDTRDMFLDRSEVLNVNGTGPIKVGVLFDSVYRDTTDDSLVFSMAVRLEDELPQNPGDGPCPNGPGCVENEAEFNFLLRSGSEGFTVQAASAERRDGSLRLFNAARTSAKTLNGATPFDPDVVRFQTDINVSELNPSSRFFLMKSDAQCWQLEADAIEINQAGEEGQPQVSIFLNGFTPRACTAVPASPLWAVLAFAGLLGVFGTQVARRRA